MYIISTVGMAGVWRLQVIKGKALRVECQGGSPIARGREECTRRT